MSAGYDIPISLSNAQSAPSFADDFLNDPTYFIFGNGNTATASPENNPAQESNPTATASTAQGGVATATAPGNPAGVSTETAATAGGPNWMLIGIIGAVGFAAWYLLKK